MNYSCTIARCDLIIPVIIWPDERTHRAPLYRRCCHLQKGNNGDDSRQGATGNAASTTGDRGRGRAAGLAAGLATARVHAAGLAAAGHHAAGAGSSASLDNRQGGRVAAGGGNGLAGDHVVGRGGGLAVRARHDGRVGGKGNGC